ncbi:MAG: hypothetical protein MUO53_00100 [Maribacter sp.]|nr:hypothetical protein [Maribacter sp.]
MKNVVLVLMLLVGATSIAQQDGKRQRDDMQDLTPEQMATLQTKKMTLDLDLTDAQQSQIQVLNLENAKMRQSKMAEYKANNESVEKKEITSEQRFAMQNERLDHQIAQKEKMKSILSQEQYEKWEKMDHRKSMHDKKMHGKKAMGKERKSEGRN